MERRKKSARKSSKLLPFPQTIACSCRVSKFATNCAIVWDAKAKVKVKHKRKREEETKTEVKIKTSWSVYPLEQTLGTCLCSFCTPINSFFVSSYLFVSFSLVFFSFVVFVCLSYLFCFLSLFFVFVFCFFSKKKVNQTRAQNNSTIQIRISTPEMRWFVESFDRKIAKAKAKAKTKTKTKTKIVAQNWPVSNTLA